VIGAFPPGTNTTARDQAGPEVAQPLSFDLGQAAPYMNLLAGRLPKDVAAGQPLEVLVTPKQGAQVGDTLQLRVPSGVLSLQVVGIWFPKNPQDRFWNGRSYDTVFPPPPPSGPPPPGVVPVLFTNTAFFALFAQVPQDARFVNLGLASIIRHDVYLTNLNRISAANMDDVTARVTGFEHDVATSIATSRSVGRVNVGTRLDALIGGVRQQLQTLALPLYVVVAQVLGLALLFVIAMAGLLVETQAGEIATLKSRGGSLFQLVGAYTLQGLVLVVAALLVGPFAAFALSIEIVRVFLPQASGASIDFLAGTISPAQVLRPALIGGLLGLAALMLAVWQAARLEVLAFRREQGRTSRVAGWRRYNLDLVLVVLCAAGYLELGQFGGLNVRAQLGQTRMGADPLLLATPGLLLLAGALLVLRLFPLGARAGAWLAARGRGAVGLLSFAQVARSAGQFTRLTMLLTLSVGLGLFALTFQGSLSQNAVQQASFLTGSDQRVVLPDGVSFPTITLVGRYAQMPGVVGVMPVFRSSGTVADASRAPANVLAVDSGVFARVAYWRADYADQPISTLMARMHAHLQGANAGAKVHPIWALINDAFASSHSLAVGQQFSMAPTEADGSTFSFVVGGIVHYFPTLADPGMPASVLVDQADYLAALSNPDVGVTTVSGPTEFWIRDNGSTADRALRARALQDPNLTLPKEIDDRWLLQDKFVTDPLTSGMAALLLVSAITAGVLAVLGALIQSGVAARQRVTQFAILRTLGVGGGELVRVLLGQQAIMYGFGLLGGTALGVLLATATLPFLQFTTSSAGAAALALPPYTLVFNAAGIAVFYGVLIVACVAALGVASWVALRVGLGKALRLGED
jgi:putative ABC transport system permease protein